MAQRREKTEEKKSSKTSTRLGEKDAEKGTDKFPTIGRKGQHLVRIMNPREIEDMLGLRNINEHCAEDDEGLLVCSRKSYKKKKRRAVDRISFETTIDPDTLIARTLHSYLCSCGNVPHDCPDPATMTDPEVI
ncbi:hypothetical protein LSAT2_029499 [Lamellibrachia satsuma]|nr:hypothetical protein LSAT2_029499 [Lamellibrachia satsuma]